MDAYKFGQTMGAIVGVILVILVVIYLISKLIAKGKAKTEKSRTASKPYAQKSLADYAQSKKQASKPPVNKADISGSDSERPRQKWV